MTPILQEAKPRLERFNAPGLIASKWQSWCRDIGLLTSEFCGLAPTLHWAACRPGGPSCPERKCADLTPKEVHAQGAIASLTPT